MAQLKQIRNVAIVGASGHIGGHFAEELLKTGKHTVTAITRADSKGSFPAGVKRADVDYSSEDSLVAALTGQHFLVITLSVFAPPETQPMIVKAAVKAGVPYIMPNGYGFDFLNDNLRKDDVFGEAILRQCKEIESLGASWICMVCGYWYEWSLALGDPWFSIGIKDRKAIFFDDGNTKINVSTWRQCGCALAALLSLPVEEMDQWKNKPLYIASFKVSQRDMLDSVHRVTGTTDKDWEITYEPSVERHRQGHEEMKQGIRTGFAKTIYSRIFFPTGDGVYDDKRTLANDALGLPKEKLDDATQTTVDMVSSGWSAFAQTLLNDSNLENHPAARHSSK